MYKIYRINGVGVKSDAVFCAIGNARKLQNPIHLLAQKQRK